MKFALAVVLSMCALSWSPALTAQAASQDSLSEAALYSLYAWRHDNTVAFATLAATGATDRDVRRAAANLVRAHKEAREKLAGVAGERHLTLSAPAHDTSAVLLERARRALEGKTGRSFDSTWVSLAYEWLSTLLLDNNRTVKPRIAATLQPIAQEHTTWLFHQSADIDKLRRKFR